MSSSDTYRRAAFVDLETEVPEPAREEFAEQSEFPQVERTVPVELSPDETYRNGLAEGEERGRSTALKELEPVLEELRKVAGSMTAVRAQRLSAVESELIQVATEMTRRILHGELAQADDIVLRMAHACVEEAKEEPSLVLHVAPSNLEIVRAHLPELELDLADASIEVRADDSIAPGGVVLETPLRCYDGRPERMLDHAQQQLNVEGES